MVPAQTGLGLAFAVGAAGSGVTLTETVATELGQPNAVVVTEYVPDAIVPAAGITGFCKVDVNAAGPLQE